MKKLYLTSKRLGVREVLYDDQDHNLIASHKWYLNGISGYRHTIYAQTHVYKDGKRTVISMHRLILGNPTGSVDHIDRNGLNNQRSNIRVVDEKTNRLNSRLNSNNSTGQRNIIYNPKTGKFEIKLARKINGKRNNLYFGSYSSLNEAILVRDKSVKFYDEPSQKYCAPCYNMNLMFR